MASSVLWVFCLPGDVCTILFKHSAFRINTKCRKHEITRTRKGQQSLASLSKKSNFCKLFSWELSYIISTKLMALFFTHPPPLRLRFMKYLSSIWRIVGYCFLYLCRVVPTSYIFYPPFAVSNSWQVLASSIEKGTNFPLIPSDM